MALGSRMVVLTFSSRTCFMFPATPTNLSLSVEEEGVYRVCVCVGGGGGGGGH